MQKPENADGRMKCSRRPCRNVRCGRFACMAESSTCSHAYLVTKLLYMRKLKTDIIPVL